MKNKDYIEDRYAALELVNKIIYYWHSRGYTFIKVWLEPEIQPSGRKFWNIRSNIKFNVDNIKPRVIK